MLENPYQPPNVELQEEEAFAARPRKRFRFRFIPATLCFVYGGAGVIGCLILAVALIAALVRVGPEHFNVVRMTLAYTALCCFFGLVLGSGWLWLKGRWLGAVATLVAAIAIGLAMQAVMNRLNNGRRGSREFYDAFVKPNPPSETPLINPR
jgi:hypothetical protein